MSGKNKPRPGMMDGGLWRLTRADWWYLKRFLGALPWLVGAVVLLSVSEAVIERSFRGISGSALHVYGIPILTLAWMLHVIFGIPGWWRRLDELEKNIELSVMFWLGNALVVSVSLVWAYLSVTKRSLLITQDQIGAFCLAIGLFYICARFVLRLQVER